MAQHDYVIDNASGATVRADLNSLFSAIVSQNSGATAPSPTFAYMLWCDSTTGLIKQRNSTNSGWITVGTLDTTNWGLLPTTGGTLTGNLVMSGANVETAQGANVTAAATIVLDSTTGNVIDVTGNTNISAITLGQGKWRLVRFTGTPTLTNGASLVLPGGADVVMQAGDYALVIGYAAGVVRVPFIWHGSAVPLASFLQFTGPTALRTYALPDANSTLAALAVKQVFTANQVAQSKFTSGTSTGTTTLDMTTYIDFDQTITGASTALANPTLSGSSVGQRGTIWLRQDATGGRLLASVGSQWKRIGSDTTTPVLSTAANAIDRIDYHVVSTTRIEYAFNAVVA